MKKYFVAVIAIAALLMAGFLVPLGSYTTSNGCQLEKTPTARLHLIKGDRLDEVKNQKDPIGTGCTINTKYVLYLL